VAVVVDMVISGMTIEEVLDAFPELSREDIYEALRYLARDYTRITVDPEQMGGSPCLRGLRTPLATIVGALTHGRSEQAIREEYPDVQPEDIHAALAFAAAAKRQRELALTTV